MMLAHKFLSNVNDTRAMIGSCSLVTSRWCQIRYSCRVQPFTIYSAYSNWSLATYPFFSSSKTICISLSWTVSNSATCRVNATVCDKHISRSSEYWPKRQWRIFASDTTVNQDGPRQECLSCNLKILSQNLKLITILPTTRAEGA